MDNISVKCNFLTKKTHKNTKFTWKTEDKQRLKRILEEIRMKTILHYPDKNKTFTLETDASQTGFGARLVQDNKIVGFYSHKLTPKEANYTVMEKEIMSIVRSLEYFKHLIWNSKIEIKTDNKDLISKKNLSSRAQKCQLRLEEFNYELLLIPGKNNVNADTLSRLCYIKSENFKFNVNSFTEYSSHNAEENKENNTGRNLKKIIIDYKHAKSVLKEIHEALLHQV